MARPAASPLPNRLPCENPATTSKPSARRPDQAADDDHRQHVDQALVRRQGDRAARHRQLHLRDELPGARPGRCRRLDGGRRYPADAVGNDLHRDRRGEDDRGHDRGEPACTEEREERHEVDERGHDLAGVEHRPDHPVGAGAAAHPHPDDDAERPSRWPSRRGSRPAWPSRRTTARCRSGAPGRSPP